MAGHSRWAQIKHQKGVSDLRKGQLFTKLAREIAVAVRQGGPNPETNYRLRLAIQKARDNNMPMENIERVIKRTAGGDSQDHLEEVVYEGYGPGGVAILLQALTSNRNRTISEVRSTFAKAGGSLGQAGCVLWNFQPKGVITLELEPQEAEEVALQAIDAGAEDVKVEGGYLEIHTSPEDLEAVRRELEGRGLRIASAELSMVPKNMVTLSDREAEQTLRLLDNLEELPDVQKVYTNADFPEAVLERYRREG
jgi:YebC/PmpR family DNA-binding regulatory protein